MNIAGRDSSSKSVPARAGNGSMGHGSNGSRKLDGSHGSWVTRWPMTHQFFTARRSYASAVLGVVILSVCLSVCHTRDLWLIQRTYRWYFYTAWKGNPSSFLPPNSGWWATSPSTFNGRSKWPTPFKNCSRRQISVCNVSTVRASKKVQLWRTGSRTRAFQRAIDQVRTLLLSQVSQRLAQKANFSFFE